MKRKPKCQVIRLTRADWEAYKREEAEARMELVHRVERGELTAAEANREAALVKNPRDWRTINLKEHLDGIADLFPVNYLDAGRRTNGRRG